MNRELEVTDMNFDSTVGTGVALVDFWAPWCGPCKMQGPIVRNVAEQMGDAARVGKCNVDTNPELAVRFGVRSIPTLVLLKDGEEVERFVGLQTDSLLLEKLRALSGES